MGIGATILMNNHLLTLELVQFRLDLLSKCRREDVCRDIWIARSIVLFGSPSGMNHGSLSRKLDLSRWFGGRHWCQGMENGVFAAAAQVVVGTEDITNEVGHGHGPARGNLLWMERWWYLGSLACHRTESGSVVKVGRDGLFQVVFKQVRVRVARVLMELLKGWWW